MKSSKGGEERSDGRHNKEVCAQSPTSVVIKEPLGIEPVSKMNGSVGEASVSKFNCARTLHTRSLVSSPP